MKKFEKITDLQSALDYNGETLEQFNARTVFDTDSQKASKELEVIAQALNEGKVMTYKNINVGKYYPVFCAVGSGRGFAFDYYGFDHTYSIVGARHTVDTSEKATYFGTQFIGIWDRHING